MLLPSHGDHQSNPKLMNIDGFDVFSVHIHEYNYMRMIKNCMVSSQSRDH